MASMKAEKPESPKIAGGLNVKAQVCEAKPKPSTPKKTEQKPRAPTKKVQAKVSKAAAKN